MFGTGPEYTESDIDRKLREDDELCFEMERVMATQEALWEQDAEDAWLERAYEERYEVYDHPSDWD